MIEGLVTVVIPVYKTEKYLNRCMESIVNQTYRNIEILMIDDGSPDNCPQMCDAWAEKDSRIRVIHKENAGLGMARNTGIDNATGEYICFFDSDDYVALDTIEKTYQQAAEEQADVVHFGFRSVDAEGKVVSSVYSNEGKLLFCGEEVLEQFLPELIAPEPNGDGQRRFYMSACMMLYSVDTIKRSGWKFVSEREIVSEDVYFLLGLFRYVNCVAVVPEAFYNYCTNEVSLSRKYMPGRYKKIKHFYEESTKLCDAMAYGQKIKERMAIPYLAFTIAALKQEMASDRTFWYRKQSVFGILCDAELQQTLAKNRIDHKNWKQKVLFWAIRKKKTLLCCCLLAMQNAWHK